VISGVSESSSPAHALSQLGVVRATGGERQHDRARKSYQDFFAQWEGADQDLPVLMEEKKEYEQLK